MSLLVDNQQPVALARFLAANGWECSHVQDVGLDSVNDSIIWEYAKEAVWLSLPRMKISRFLPIARAVFRRKLFGFASAIAVRRYCSMHFPGSRLRCETCWLPVTQWSKFDRYSSVIPAQAGIQLIEKPREASRQ